MALRKCQYDGRYTLSQDHPLIMRSNMCRRSKPVASIHSNDKVRVYGIVMSISENRPWYERLSEGCTIRNHVDDPAFSSKEIFQNIATSFNNYTIIIDFPVDTYDLPGIEDLDANDIYRIQIERYCE